MSRVGQSSHQFNTHVVNSDLIYLKNQNDRFSSHIDIKTSGTLGENDINLKTCNIKVEDGFISGDDFRFTDGTTQMITFPNSSSIDFKNKTPLNLDKADKDAKK